MRRYIEFPLDEGGFIMVEIDEPEPDGGLVKASRESAMIERSQLNFDQALDKVRPAANAIIGKLRKLSDPPDEIEVEFGLKMSAEAGAVVAAPASKPIIRSRSSGRGRKVNHPKTRLRRCISTASTLFFGNCPGRF
jgi:hypothetical protein